MDAPLLVLQSFTPIFTPSGTSGSSSPEWFYIAATLFSGGVGAYLVRQLVERIKLTRSLRNEISGMRGLELCSNAMSSRDRKPSEEPLQPSEIPSPGTIPTQIYESNVARIGLLKSDDMEEIIDFYTEVIYYKSLMEDLRNGNDVPEPDQVEFYDSISDLSNKRKTLFGENWLDD